MMTGTGMHYTCLIMVAIQVALWILHDAAAIPLSRSLQAAVESLAEFQGRDTATAVRSLLKEATGTSSERAATNDLISTLPTAPILPVVLSRGSPRNILQHLHTGIPRLLLAADYHGISAIFGKHIKTNTGIEVSRNAHQLFSLNETNTYQSSTTGVTKFPTPAAILFLLSHERSARWQLSGMLPALRNSLLWTAGAFIVVVIPHEAAIAREAIGAQRALARWGAWRAAVVFGGPQGASKQILHLTPARRPMRLPPPAAASASIPRFSEVSGVAVVFSAYIGTSFWENMCLVGDWSWSYDRPHQMLQEVAKRMRITPLCAGEHNKFRGARLDNGTYTGLMAGVARGRTDLLFFEGSPEVEWMQNCQFFYPVGSNSFCLWVRKAAPLPFLHSLLGAFAPATWAGLGATLAFLATARAVAGETVAQAVLSVYAAFLTGAWGAFSRGRHSVLASIGLLTAAMGVVIISAFQGSFASSLASPTYEEEIDSVRAVGERLKFIHADTGVVHSFTAQADDVLTPYKAKIIFTDEPFAWYTAVDKMLLQGDRAVLISSGQEPMVVRYKKYTRDGYSLLHRVSECVLTYTPSSFAARLHSPLVPKVEVLFAQMVQAGLWSYMWTRSERKMKLASLIKGRETRRPYKLRLDHLEAAFKILMYGLSVAMLVLILEVVWVHLRSNISALRWNNNDKRR